MTAYTPPAEAVEAAARAMYAERIETGDFPDGPTEWDDLPEPWRDEWREGATAALTAAGPIIERETGERIAREIERLRGPLTDDPDRAALELLIEDAARIAREEGA